MFVSRSVIPQMKVIVKLKLCDTPRKFYFLVFYVFARTGFNFSADDMKERPILTYHRMIEAFNFVAAKETYLADPRFSDKTDEVGKTFKAVR